jgi:hypothetical protein
VSTALGCVGAREGVAGTWRSLVAHLTGGQGVAGSNPVVPTVIRPGQGPDYFVERGPDGCRWSPNLTKSHTIQLGLAVRRRWRGSPPLGGVLRDAGVLLDLPPRQTASVKGRDHSTSVGAVRTPTL